MTYRDFINAWATRLGTTPDHVYDVTRELWWKESDCPMLSPVPEKMLRQQHRLGKAFGMSDAEIVSVTTLPLS